MQGMTRYIVNAEFNNLKKGLFDVVANFGREGKTLYNARNMIKLVMVDNHELVFKQYKKLGIIKQLIYKFRRNKASRAYHNALRLIESGVSTPSPVAFVNEYNGLGLLRQSYYIYEYCNDPLLETFYGTENSFDHDVISAFAFFIADLHGKGIVFKDLNKSNVLVNKKSDNSISFSLIDINRMKFLERRSLSIKGRFKNVSRFCYGFPGMFAFFVEKYIEACQKNGQISSDVDAAKLKELAIKIKHKDNTRRHLIKQMKHIIKP